MPSCIGETHVCYSCMPDTWLLDFGLNPSGVIRFTNACCYSPGAGTWLLTGADAASFGLSANDSGAIAKDGGYFDLTVTRTGGSPGQHLEAVLEVTNTMGYYTITVRAEVPT